MDIFLLALKSFYFILPGVFANMAPVIFKKVNFLDYPVDFGRNFLGRPLFGSHKTFRGFFFGIVSAIVVVWIQRLLFMDFPYFLNISFIDYSAYTFMLLGFLIGFGARLGDLVKSFVKRRLNIAPGKCWFPWDQLDSLLGGLLVLSIIYIPPWQAIVFLVIIAPVLHVTINRVAYWCGWKETPW